MADKYDNLPQRESMRRSSNADDRAKSRFGQKIDQTDVYENHFNADVKSLRTANDESDEEIAAHILKLVDKYKATYGEKEEKELADYLEKHNLNLRISRSVDKTEKSEIARMTFNGVLKKPLDAQSLKPNKFNDNKKRPLGCSEGFIQAINTPSQYSQRLPWQEYDLSASSIWNVFEQVPEFAAMKEKVAKALSAERIPQELLPSLNMNDFKYLMYYHCCLRSKKREDSPGYLFFPTDENGNLVCDANNHPITTSKKKENVKAFIKKNKKEFSRKLMSVRGINKEYVKTLIDRMEKDGCTDMSCFLAEHPEWKDQPAFNVHHIVNIKDCKVLEDEGRPFHEINNLDNMCFVTNGTIENSMQRNNTSFKGNVHKLLHCTDFEFHNKEEGFKKPDVAIRIEPRRGVSAMLGFVNHHVIVNQEYREATSREWRQQQYDTLLSKQQSAGREE